MLVNYHSIITRVSCTLCTQLWFVHLIVAMQMMLVLMDLIVAQIETRNLDTSNLTLQVTWKLDSRWVG